MPLSSNAAAACRVAREPTVERSTMIFTALPSLMPPSPKATSVNTAGLGRLVNTTPT
jgi:hypothetical protein